MLSTNIAATSSILVLHPQLLPQLKSIRPCTLLNSRSQMLNIFISLGSSVLFLLSRVIHSDNVIASLYWTEVIHDILAPWYLVFIMIYSRMAIAALTRSRVYKPPVKIGVLVVDRTKLHNEGLCAIAQRRLSNCLLTPHNLHYVKLRYCHHLASGCYTSLGIEQAVLVLLTNQH